MKKKLYSIICLCSLISIILCACGKKEQGSAGNTPATITFQATVIESSDSSILAEPVPGSLELDSADQFSIPNIDGLELQAGDIIEMEYNGEILESYPAQLGKVYSIKMRYPMISGMK